MRRDVVAQKKDGTKTQTLSLRLDPKTKFTLEFVARVKGQTLTTVVERAIRESCDRVTISGPGNSFSDPSSCNWQAFWHPDQGVRTLSLLESPDYPSNFEEDYLKEFTRAHWEFFYRERDGITPRPEFVKILWPKIETYRRIWNERRETDYWAAGRAMAADLQAAKLPPPAWPRTPATKR
jgi:hypothetical protein